MKIMFQKTNVKIPVYKCVILLFLITIIDSFAQKTSTNSSGAITDFDETPKIKWVFKTRSPIFSSPVVSDSLVYFGGLDSLLYAIDIHSGKGKWRFHTKGEIRSDPSIKGDKLFLNGGADERVLIAVEPETGKEIWKKSMEFLVFGNNAYSESMLYLGTTIGKLHGISLDSGEKIWSFETESYQNIRNKYFKPDDSYRDDIYSIIRTNEQFLEAECELGGIFSTPLIYDDNIIFSSTNGSLYCLKR